VGPNEDLPTEQLVKNKIAANKKAQLMVFLNKQVPVFLIFFIKMARVTFPNVSNLAQ
jgi:hypothetical protein